MRYLLALADAIAWVTEYLGQWLKWLVLFSRLIRAVHALMRYSIHYSSNAWLEIQWYMFGAMFLLAAGYALKHEEHVRVDVFFSKMTPKQQAWLDVFGGIFFLMPVPFISACMATPMVFNPIHIMEHPSDPGGLIRWPIKIIIPIGFLLLAIQGVAEIIKKFAVATGIREPGRAYERPVQ